MYPLPAPQDHSPIVTTMPLEIGRALADLTESAPAGELKEIYNDLVTMLPDQQVIIREYVAHLAETQGIVIPGEGIASQENKNESSGKFWDCKRKKMYNVTFIDSELFDHEEATSKITYPDLYNELVEKIQEYGDSQFPSQFEFNVIPESATKLTVLLIGQKLNKSNFYTGRWRASYKFDESEQAHGDISIDIHYYEEGNVRFQFEESIQKKCKFSASAIVNFIQSVENAALMKVINQFTALNQNHFKTLRRLLPVTKSRINWGNAIGNYKLGTDVIDEQ